MLVPLSNQNGLAEGNSSNSLRSAKTADFSHHQLASAVAGFIAAFWLMFFVVGAANFVQATDVVTYHNDNARTGQNLKETILIKSNVNSSSFGKLFTFPVDGKIDAEPLYLSAVSIPGKGTHNVIYAVTENDSVYAFDADNGTPLWQVSVLGQGETPSDDHGCGQISPQIGITSTPVIDRSSGLHGTVYVVAMSKNSTSYIQRIHGLDMTTGQEEFGGPVVIKATYRHGQVIFDPGQYAERQGLLLLNHVIYTAWTSHCDFGSYTGWVIGYSESTLKQTSVLNVTPNGSEGSIWQSGAGMASDGINIFFLDANGTFDTTLNKKGFPSLGDYGNGFIKLSTTNNKLAVADYFNMFNTVDESNSDLDLGSGGALLLPPLKDAKGKTRYLAIGAGKDTNIYIVDRLNMGKFNPNNNAIYQEIDGVLGAGMWAMPAYFNGSVYFGPYGNNLLQFRLSKARLSKVPVSKSKIAFHYPGSTPSVSANGTNNGIIWTIEHSLNPDVLRAYDATNLAKELYDSNQASKQRDQFGIASHFGTPMIANGKVYVGTENSVAAFGLLGH
jgi:outer membrane protein assembly factor BamB